MEFFYKKTDARHVKFQRIMMGWLAIASLFFREIDLVWIFFGITVLGFATGTEYSLVTLVYKLFYALFRRDLVRVSSHHIRYYQINTAMDFIDHLLRLVASSVALVLYYSGAEIAGWVVMSFLSIFMMLSAYFGFCLSALTYIALQNIRQKFQKRSTAQSATPCFTHIGDEKPYINENCILAKRCFTPYKRCDVCHVNVGKCLGTKFNTLVLAIGVLMGLFLFVKDPVFVQINILLIMALIFWLGYQINYSTDELAQSNDENIALNKQLKSYTVSLETEVKSRTAELEHLASHDMLTGALNRFSFEKVLTEALADVNDSGSSHLAYIDLDKFKLVNDTAGHLAGDKLLCDIAAIFTTCVEDKGVVARLGGDEFAILFQGISQSKALEYCHNICEEVNAYEFMWEDQVHSTGTSIGLATLEVSMQDIKAVVHHADQACYVAKKSGRNRVSVHSPLSS
ncbi:MAG: DUF4395 family protein [Sulfurimonadaceae bacterium]